MTEVQLRSPSLADLPGVYRVCDLTGAGESSAGGDRNPELLGHVFAGPYVVAHPTWCRVVVDAFGVAGYLLATPDTDGFAEWAERSWWPSLREQYPPDAPVPPGQRWLVDLLHRPVTAPREVVAGFPAHLHIDLLARVRGTGLAGRLLRDLFARLAAAGVAGVHLGVGTENAHAIGFYEHLGFARAGTAEDTLWMTRGLGRVGRGGVPGEGSPSLRDL